jgi:cell shape-determining protein MreC
MSQSKIKYKYLQPFILLILGLILVSFSRLEISTYLRVPFSYVFGPVATSSSNIGNSFSNWTNALFDASSYIEEHNRIRGELLELQSKEIKILDIEEYESLKKNNSLINIEGEYVLSKVLSYSDKGNITINKGTNEGIKVGDPVVIGNLFLGVISSVDTNGSIVRLPTNRSSTYEVVILPSDYSSEEGISLDGFVLSTGVMSGSVDGIRLENIGINATVTDGNYVIVRDERIGELLVVGRLVGLSKNPASTSKAGYVSPVFDYSNLLTVYVKIK